MSIFSYIQNYSFYEFNITKIKFQANDEYDERPRRRHPAGSSFIRAQVS